MSKDGNTYSNKKDKGNNKLPMFRMCKPIANPKAVK